MSKTILAIGAHLDDAEWGSGGVLLNAAKKGNRVVIVTTIGSLENFPSTANKKKTGEIKYMQK